jgi:hypothetical protein
MSSLTIRFGARDANLNDSLSLAMVQLEYRATERHRLQESVTLND